MHPLLNSTAVQASSVLIWEVSQFQALKHRFPILGRNHSCAPQKLSRLSCGNFGDLESEHGGFALERVDLMLAMLELVDLGSFVHVFTYFIPWRNMWYTKRASLAAMALVATGAPSRLRNRRNCAPK